MTAQTPMGPDSKFVITKHGDNALSASFDDGNGNVTRVALQSSEASEDVFRWLISCAATFHSIPVVDVQISTTTEKELHHG